MDFQTAWGFLCSHRIFNVGASVNVEALQSPLAALLSQGTPPAGIRPQRFSRFEDGLSVSVFEAKGVAMVSLEACVPVMTADGHEQVTLAHDMALDVVAPSFEAAVGLLADRVLHRHGKDTQGVAVVIRR